jgi:hypothetical protein
LAIFVGGAKAQAPPTTVTATPQVQAMQRMLADIDQLRAYAYGSGDQAGAAAAAHDLLSWSERLPDLFPPGQASKDYLDMSPERARAAPEAMRRNAQSLVDVMSSGNRAAVGDKLARMEKSGCGACHRVGSGGSPP